MLPSQSKSSIFHFSLFFFFFLSQSKFLNYETTSTLRLYFSTMCCTWSTLDEIFSFIKKKNSGFILQPCVVRGLPLFIKKNCDFYRSTMCCTWILLKKKKVLYVVYPLLIKYSRSLKK